METVCPNTGAVQVVPDTKLVRLQRRVEALEALLGKLLFLMPEPIRQHCEAEMKELGL